MCELHNCTRGLPQSCLARYPASEWWKCLFGMNLIEHASIPTLVFNSLVDTWQLMFVYNWHKCSIDTAEDGLVIAQEYTRPLYNGITPKLAAMVQTVENLSECN